MMHMICINLLCIDIFVNVICYAYIHDFIYIYICEVYAVHLGFSLSSMYPLLFPHQIGWALLPDPATQLEENLFPLECLASWTS